jgi:ATP-dependent helicase/nuclease subunit A
MSLTPIQQRAVAARGNVLVMAGAGTGKTRTLVERCLGCLLDRERPVSLEQLLVVTFTEAAATEIRQRLRQRLEEEAARDPENGRWPEQLALFETANIGTLHSFCLKLVRQHFYILELDPQFVVLSEEEEALLANESLEELLERHYSGKSRNAAAVQELIENQGRRGEQLIRELILRLHRYSQTLPDPDRWLKAQVGMFAREDPVDWRNWLESGLADWRDRWLAVLEAISPANVVAGGCARVLAAWKQDEAAGAGQPVPGSAKVCGAPEEQAGRLSVPEQLNLLQQQKDLCPPRQKGKLIDPIEALFDEADFLLSVTEDPDALAQDWGWVREPMLTLLELARDFGEAYGSAKKELGVVDFQDLEQQALKLLWDREANGPTPVASEWRDRLQFVFVDEYQDINAAQDLIITALGRPAESANRFLVGDIKQSIYRFRLADPSIFRHYAQAWRTAAGCVIPLNENFRSREGILGFVNSLFAPLMKPAAGGISYDEEASLRFGAPGLRAALSVQSCGPCVELGLRLKEKGRPAEKEGNGEGAGLEDLEASAKEARWVALRLRELKLSGFEVWDEAQGQMRPVEWRDMAILLRSRANKAETFAREFARLGIPLSVERGGFYESIEITDLLSLLQILDNPLQDLPLLAVLRSPIVGLSANEFAEIRLATRGHFWTALNRWDEAFASRDLAVGPGAAAFAESLAPKVREFLQRFQRWRKLVRQTALSRCLEHIIAETKYEFWLLVQPRGEQRLANVKGFCKLARQFDRFQRHSLFRFLRFVDAQQLAAADPEVSTTAEQDAIRLLTIHQSKGLEFPVVVAADLGKNFNLSDLSAPLILDEQYGLCPHVKPPPSRLTYPSLPYWLAKQRQLGESLGEEMRLLYVALTRARDLLVLSGSTTRKRFEDLWHGRQPALDPVLSARSYLDWIGHWFSLQKHTPSAGPDEAGHCQFLTWRILADDSLVERAEPGEDQAAAPNPFADLTPAEIKELKARLEWAYPHAAATVEPAKTSVTSLRRLAAPSEESVSFWRTAGVDPGEGHSLSSSGVDAGLAHHKFMQSVDLGRTGDRNALESEVKRLVEAGALGQDEASLLDLDALVAFWSSELGSAVRANAPTVKRELPFTARFSPAELAELAGVPAKPGLDDEFTIVQGVVDLAIFLKDEIWLLDFKTDAAAGPGLAEKMKAYAPQLRVYAAALSRTYGRPVTACWLYFLALRKAVNVPLA